MFKLLTFVVLSAGILLFLPTFGQGWADIPLGAMPMQYNPSFAGQMGGPRISSSMGYDLLKFNYRDVPESRKKSYSLYTSYDQFIPAIRSGIGITAGFGGDKNIFNSVVINNKHVRHDITDRNKFLSIALAPKLSIKGKYTLSPSVDMAYATFRSHTIYYPDYPADSGRRNINFINQEWQSKAGLLLNTNKFYMGYSVVLFNYLKNPATNSFLNIKVDFQSFFQIGYTFQRRSTSKFSFTPQLLLSISKFNSAAPLRLQFEDIIVNFRYQQFIWGGNNRGIHLGWQTDQLRILFTNSLGIGGGSGTNRFRYIGNLSLRFILNSKNQRVGRTW
jgi:hypothetical protein